MSVSPNKCKHGKFNCHECRFLNGYGPSDKLPEYNLENKQGCKTVKVKSIVFKGKSNE